MEQKAMRSAADPLSTVAF